MHASSATLLVLLASALAPALAVAHQDHWPCGTSTSADAAGVHVDAWRRGCLGAAVSLPALNCRGIDAHTPGLHVLVLRDAGCQTGVIAQFLRGEPTVDGLLP